MPDMTNYQYLINPHFNCEHDIAKRFIPLRMGLLTIYQWLLRQLVA